jgi:hypothetical protein
VDGKPTADAVDADFTYFDPSTPEISEAWLVDRDGEPTLAATTSEIDKSTSDRTSTNRFRDR